MDMNVKVWLNNGTEIVVISKSWPRTQALEAETSGRKRGLLFETLMVLENKLLSLAPIFKDDELMK